MQSIFQIPAEMLRCWALSSDTDPRSGGWMPLPATGYFRGQDNGGQLDKSEKPKEKAGNKGGEGRGTQPGKHGKNRMAKMDKLTMPVPAPVPIPKKMPFSQPSPSNPHPSWLSLLWTKKELGKMQRKGRGRKSFRGRGPRSQRGASSGGDLNKICWFYWKVMMCQILYRITRARLLFCF